MNKILIVSVGGSFQPVVTSINSLQPDRVIFFCSGGPKGSIGQVTGDGKPCEVRKGAEVTERLPNIPTQVSLGERFQPGRDVIAVENPDDLSECYRKLTDKIGAILGEGPDIEMMADYTGGTKTMSVGLAMAALDHGIDLYITTAAARTNIIKVECGEFTGRARFSGVIYEQKMKKLLPGLLRKFDYPGAIAELQYLLKTFELSGEDRKYAGRLLDCCRGFDAWDRFEHTEALELLKPHMRYEEIRSAALFLKRIMASRKIVDEAYQAGDSTAGHGYEIVEDLLMNAERRARQERYDDAVGRIYRALELLAQIRLRLAYGIKTGEVDLEKIPAPLREKHAAMADESLKKVRLTLRRSYELLSELDGDPLGGLYRTYANRIIDALEIRNNSLFAHGFQPITKKDYDKVSDALESFITGGIAAVIPPKAAHKPVQFPTTLRLQME